MGAHSPSSVNALRFLAASAVMLPAMRRGLARPEMRRDGLELGLWLLIGYTAQSLGVAQTTAGHAAFASTWAAGAAAMLGVALLDGGGEGLSIGQGYLLCVLSAVFFGVHKVRMEGVTARFPDDTEALTGMQIAVVTLGSLLWAGPEVAGVLREGGLTGLADFAAHLPWATAVYMGVATTALTLWMEARAMKVVSAPMAALIYSSEPLWGAGLSFLVLGERWGPAGVAGASLILGSSIATQLGGDKTKQE